MVSRLRVCHDRSASQSKPSSAMVASRCTRPAAAYRSVSGGTGSSTNARRSANSASWIGPSPEANRSPAGIGTASNAACDSSSRTARSKPTLIAAIWAGVGGGGPSSADQRNAPPTTSTRAHRPTSPSSQPSGPSTTSVSRSSSIQPSVSSTPRRRPASSTSSTSSPINHQPNADSAGCIRTNPSAPSSESTHTVHAVPSTSAGTNTNPSLTSVNDVSSCSSRSSSSRPPRGRSHGAPSRERSTSTGTASSPNAPMTESRRLPSLTTAPIMPQAQAARRLTPADTHREPGGGQTSSRPDGRRGP